MSYIAAYDIGTTAVKGVLTDENGTCAASKSIDLPILFSGEYKEQEPEYWYEAFCEIGRYFAAEYGGESITAVIMSGQMQDLILVDEAGTALCPAILYSDGRAFLEAGEVMEKLGADYLQKVTGNHYDGSLPFPKLLWIKKNRPEIYTRIHKVLISSKDYVTARLTGCFIGDVTACATAGAMDIHKKEWDWKLLNTFEIPPEWMPKLCYSHETVGKITADAAAECGYLEGTMVYAGVGDAGATTLASGITKPGEYNINLGTSGWVAMTSNDVVETEGGVFNLAAMPENRYINVVPFFNAGNVHQWVSRLFSEDALRDGQGNQAASGVAPDYEKIGKLLAKSEAGAHGVQFLPYLSGERFPVVDAKIKGGFYGLTPDTDKNDLLRACLEGVAYSIRQGMESLGIAPVKISIIGGGAREKIWCQIFADVTGSRIYVYKQSDILPSLAIAAAVLRAQGKIESYEEFTASLQNPERCEVYEPNAEHADVYEKGYQSYKRLYPVLKQLEESD